MTQPGDGPKGEKHEAGAELRQVAPETVIDEAASDLPAAPGQDASRRAGLIGLGASSSGRTARDADAMLADGFGSD